MLKFINYGKIKKYVDIIYSIFQNFFAIKMYKFKFKLYKSIISHNFILKAIKIKLIPSSYSERELEGKKFSSLTYAQIRISFSLESFSTDIINKHRW